MGADLTLRRNQIKQKGTLSRNSPQERWPHVVQYLCLSFGPYAMPCVLRHITSKMYFTFPSLYTSIHPHRHPNQILLHCGKPTCMCPLIIFSFGWSDIGQSLWSCTPVPTLPTWICVPRPCCYLWWHARPESFPTITGPTSKGQRQQ